jgi:DNA-binding MarR family transcriptional regulator
MCWRIQLDSRSAEFSERIDSLLWVMQARCASTFLTAHLTPCGITLDEYELLSTLKHGPLAQAEIGDQISYSVPSLSRRLKKLELDGWLIRQVAKGDRRRYVVSMTIAGTSRLASVSAALERASAGLVADLNPEEQRLLARTLRHLQLKMNDTRVGSTHNDGP